MIIKHSIIVICYNQENYIRKALDSVLCEQVKPYEIIIGDDCSTDGTIEILKEYKSKYPEIINLILNKNNLGIFENLNNVTPKATGDIISFLAGDDWYMPGLLEAMNNKIDELNLDPHKLRFILLPNGLHYNLDGSFSYYRNNLNVLNRFTPVGAVLRNKVYTRIVGISRALYDLWPSFPTDSAEIGPWTDRVQFIMFAQYIDRQVILDFDGTVYRTGVGIAAKTGAKKLKYSYLSALHKIHSNYLDGRLNLGQLDLRYLEFHVLCMSLIVRFDIKIILPFILAMIKLLYSDIREIDSVISNIYQLILSIVRKPVVKFKK